MDEPAERVRRRLVYAVEGPRAVVDDHVIHALEALRPLMDDIVVIVPDALEVVERQRLRAVCDSIAEPAQSVFQPTDYRDAIRQRRDESGPAHEVILSGDSWFGPVSDFSAVIDRMAEVPCAAWQLVENAHGHQPESFPGEGFPLLTAPWVWTVLREEALSSMALEEFWVSHAERPHDAEYALPRALREAGLTVEFAFPASDFRSGDPLVFSARALLSAGCPVVGKAQFRLFPPYLDQHAVIGREMLARLDENGFPTGLIRQSLARSVPPKALNTNAGMLDVLPLQARPDTSSVDSLTIIVILHVSEFVGLDEVLQAIRSVPAGYDLLVTTGDGMTAAQVQARMEELNDLGFGSLEVRVVPPGPGRDMSDFFVGCRDVLLNGGHDIVIKLHNRPSPRKTLNLRRYSRRYQLDNLLGSSGYARNLLQMFVREPGLGLVFPPMVHIGFGTMGRGWAGLEGSTKRVLDKVGIRVPVDAVSPLAPYGGMWIARPDALRRMVEPRWRHADYRRGRRDRELAHVQERTVVLAAAEDGFHARTVLTPEHASISHTALQFKTDQVSMSVRGYPIDQIRFLHGAGAMGFGGPVGLFRMYLRLNHFGMARRLLPIYYFARRGYGVFARARRVLSRGLRRGEDSE
ncbi:rhamnan synthesis F family protein [Microbacterium sp. H37-C3]|uniref:rhamnan synthesis F family protein n=1 Tax=Microbacterium sp. H37-C3 TaxID=3004354 RepID=UPI0022AFCDBA|nr:rhamnan synthesis F family protein [Microbacterium sp. H37-C3]